MATRRLQNVAEPDIVSLSILKQVSAAPVIAGVEPDGETYLCGSCQTELATDVEPLAIWDVAFRCQECGNVSISPTLPRGQPLPQKTVVLGVGEYLIASSIEQRVDVVLAGQAAVDRRSAETAAPTTERARPLDAQRLLEFARRGEALLGNNFGKLDAAYRRSLARSPSKDVHRLVELIAIARDDAAAFDGDQPGVHLLEIVELSLAIELFERWERDPAMQGLLEDLKGTKDFAHILVTLTAASYLTDAGNGVELVRPSREQGQRTPDLRLHMGARTRVNCEVKVPDPLVRPADPVDIGSATEIVRNAVSKAGTGTRGQLSPEHPGLLIVGGLHLRTTDVDRLEGAARAVTAERPRHRTHIAGIAAVAVGSSVEGFGADSGGLTVGQDISMSAIASVRIALNPNYSGDTAISTEPPTNTHNFGPEQLADVTLDALNAAQQGKRLGRNDPCWCGSGRKFKKCHGA